MAVLVRVVQSPGKKSLPRSIRELQRCICYFWKFKSLIVQALRQSDKKCHYLILPWNRYRACGKLGIEVVICLVQVHSLDSWKLFNVQHIFAVHCSRLPQGKRKENKSVWIGGRNEKWECLWVTMWCFFYTQFLLQTGVTTIDTCFKKGPKVFLN